MESDRDIQDAERAKLEAIIAEHGTDSEKFQFVLSGVMRNGVTLAQLEGTEPVGYLPPEPALLARLARRAERRAKLGLPAVPCAGDPPTLHGCDCLERALDEPREGGKRAVLKLAAGFHWHPRSRPVQPIERLVPDPPKAQNKEPAPQLPPKAKAPEPPPRVVVRSRRCTTKAPRSAT
jgi:hypothetical protein